MDKISVQIQILNRAIRRIERKLDVLTLEMRETRRRRDADIKVDRILARMKRTANALHRQSIKERENALRILGKMR